MWDCIACGVRAIAHGLSHCPRCRKERDDMPKTTSGGASNGAGAPEPEPETAPDVAVAAEPAPDPVPAQTFSAPPSPPAVPAVPPVPGPPKAT